MDCICMSCVCVCKWCRIGSVSVVSCNRCPRPFESCPGVEVLQVSWGWMILFFCFVVTQGPEVLLWHLDLGSFHCHQAIMALRDKDGVTREWPQDCTNLILRRSYRILRLQTDASSTTVLMIQRRCGALCVSAVRCSEKQWNAVNLAALDQVEFEETEELVPHCLVSMPSMPRWTMIAMKCNERESHFITITSCKLPDWPRNS